MQDIKVTLNITLPTNASLHEKQRTQIQIQVGFETTISADERSQTAQPLGPTFIRMLRSIGI